MRLVVENAGWLPTNVTTKAIERNVAQQVEATMQLPDGVSLAAGTTTVKMGHLAGRVGRISSIGLFAGLNDLTSDRAKAEWVVVGPQGSVVELTAGAPRAGSVRAAVTLTE